MRAIKTVLVLLWLVLFLLLVSSLFLAIIGSAQYFLMFICVLILIIATSKGLFDIAKQEHGRGRPEDWR